MGCVRSLAHLPYMLFKTNTHLDSGVRFDYNLSKDWETDQRLDAVVLYPLSIHNAHVLVWNTIDALAEVKVKSPRNHQVILQQAHSLVAMTAILRNRRSSCNFSSHQFKVKIGLILLGKFKLNWCRTSAKKCTQCYQDTMYM
jgi:hypothetical protein